MIILYIVAGIFALPLLFYAVMRILYDHRMKKRNLIEIHRAELRGDNGIHWDEVIL